MISFLLDFLLPITLGIGGLYVLRYHIKNIRAIRAAVKSPQKNDFIFKRHWSDIAFPVLFISMFTWLHLGNLDFQLIPLYLLTLIFLILALINNRQIISFQEEAINASFDITDIKSYKIMNLRISQHEVTIRTQLPKKTYRFKTEYLLGKSWLEFQQAVEGFRGST